MAPVRVLVAEDSPTARDLIVQILQRDPDILIVGTASDGHEAIELTRQVRPDVLTMDVRMPGIDGFDATRRIMAEVPTPIVIISGHYDPRDVESSMHALRTGALTILPKPSGPGAPDFDAQCRWIVQTVKAMADVRVVRRRPPVPAAAPVPGGATTKGPARIVAVAASTGGPAALAHILTRLPPTFGLPLLIVQHIANGFAEGLAAWLNSESALPVLVASECEPLKPGTVYLAPDDRHLTVLDERTAGVVHTAAVGGFRPSGSVLFDSAAQVFGSGVVAVILTGMGEDGVSGLRHVRARGGRVIAQDEDTSVVFGMPGAAVRAGVADAVLPLDAIAMRISELGT